MPPEPLQTHRSQLTVRMYDILRAGLRWPAERVQEQMRLQWKADGKLFRESAKE